MIAAEAPETGLALPNAARLEALAIRGLLVATGLLLATDTWVATRLGGEGSGSLAASALFGAPVGLAASWSLFRAGRLRPVSSPFLALAAFACWSAVSVLWTVSPDETLKRVITDVQLIALVLLGWQAIRTLAELRAVLLGYLAGCLGLVALAWRNALAGSAFTYGRYSADGYDPNDMSVYVALGIPMACYLALAGPHRRDRLALLYLPVAWSALPITGSRAGLLSMGVASAVLLVWLARRGSWGPLAGLAAVGLLLVPYAAGVPADNWDRLLSVSDELGGSVGARTMIWRAGVSLLQEHPLVGVGAGAFPDAVVPAINLRIVAHSTPLSVSVELGLIGLALLVAAYLLALRGVSRAALDERLLSWGLVLTVAVGSASLTWEAKKQVWFVVLLAAVAAALPAPGPPAEDA